MASNYQIKIKSVVDTSGIQADLDKVASKYTLQIKTDISGNIQSEIDKVTTNLKTKPVSVDMQIGNSQALQQTFSYVDGQLTSINTKAKQLGTNVDTTTSKTQYLNSAIKETEKVTTSTEAAQKRQITNLQSQQTLLNNISRLSEGSLSKYADQSGLSSLNTQVQNLDTTSADYKKNLAELNLEYSKFNTAAKNAKDAAMAQNNATKENLFSLENFTASMKTAIVRTIEWASAMTLFYGSLRAIQAMIDVVIELDGAMTEYQKVSDLTGESMDAFVAKATEAGQALAKTGTQMVEAATEFKKSGYSDTDALFLAEVASMYTNIADEQLSAGESAEFIIAQMEAFNIAASDSMQIIDALNEVKCEPSHIAMCG